MNNIYVVCDVETTGGNTNQNRIIEIALVRIENQQITDTFHSLVHPGKPIPPFITNLTGISNEMVKDAPFFHEIAHEILDFVRGSTFVAHNASFDYRTLQSEFCRLGLNFELPVLDTLHLSKEYFPDLPSYKLKELTTWLDIPLKNHHRAMSDAMATAFLFLKILSLQDYDTINIINTFSHLPSTSGLYYFLDTDKNVLLVKSSQNIRKSVQQHLQSGQSKNRLIQQLYDDIDYIETDSLLLASILEWTESQRLSPSLQPKPEFLKKFGIYEYVNDHGYISFEIQHSDKRKNKFPLIQFDTVEEARIEMLKLCLQYELCENLCDLDSLTPCNLYHQQICHGACVQVEAPESYNLRAEKMIHSQLFDKKTFLLIQTNNPHHFPFVFVKEGLFHGYGFFPPDFTLYSIDDITPFLKNLQQSAMELTKLLKNILSYPKIKRTSLKMVTP